MYQWPETQFIAAPFRLRVVVHTVAMCINMKMLNESRKTLNEDGIYQTLPMHVFSSASSWCPWLQEQWGPPIAGSQWWEQPPLFSSQIFTISNSIPFQNKQKRFISITIEKMEYMLTMDMLSLLRGWHALLGIYHILHIKSKILRHILNTIYAHTVLNY